VSATSSTSVARASSARVSIRRCQALGALFGIQLGGQAYVTAPVPLHLRGFCSLPKPILRDIWDRLQTPVVVLGLLPTQMSFSRTTDPLEPLLQFAPSC